MNYLVAMFVYPKFFKLVFFKKKKIKNTSSLQYQHNTFCILLQISFAFVKAVQITQFTTKMAVVEIKHVLAVSSNKTKTAVQFFCAGYSTNKSNQNDGKNTYNAIDIFNGAIDKQSFQLY